MKTLIKKNETKIVMIFMLVMASFILTSCYGDPVVIDPEVETVVSDFLGNDAVSVDRFGNVYVSEFGQFVGSSGNGTSVFKISKNGEITEFISDLVGPLGNAIDSQGNFYVVNGSGDGVGDILKITPDGVRIVLASIEGFPAGLALDKDRNIYISNFGTPTVHKITTDGEITVFASDPRLAGGVGIEFDRKGNLIIGNFLTADILSVDPEGSVSLVTTIPDIAVGGGLGYITVAGNSVFATGIAINKIFRVSLRDGKIEEFAGTGEASTIDGSVLEASFNGPNGIRADVYGRIIYVSEFGGTGAVRKISLR
ncbi:hypothetical protein [Aquimarina sp. RZ0]|uniref:Vgb family protein n=1 Tax=Aquimarina sp. RZ0 TaxID=2607730 RepID=UPI0011F23DB6|nr:hypothetical protein [Aquimarina sp. RZ0]KAA1246209.1 hypothetical protein F0000_08720 [Aquimarina sp. RZ0]